jgi:Xaa-Pro aminopeptidase
MKQDLDRLLEDAGLDGLAVIGPARHNPNMTYFTGPVHVGFGILARRRGAPPVLYCADMERDEAARAGVEFRPLDFRSYAEESEGDELEVMAIGLEHILRDNGLAGRIQVRGIADAGQIVETVRRLQRRLPGLEIVALDDSKAPLGRARVTKDAAELDRIRRMGKITTEVVEWTARFLTSQRVGDGLLVDRQGDAVTIGDVRRRINLWLAERGAENPEGTIFSIGREAGVPHNTGSDDHPIPIGKPIILDVFPCEAGGGYYYDFTRTWCLGHAPDEVEAIYRDVLEAYRAGMAAARQGVTGQELQRATCEFFEAHGHPSVLSTPKTQEGYVHSLGHGLGLEVHEPPFFRLPPMAAEPLEEGHVLTIEPGLYYPEREIGVRLEDTVWIGPQGAEVLVPDPLDLVLPMAS